MAAIKKFFEKRKISSKFKAAGPGHALSESGSARPAEQARPSVPAERTHPSQSSQMAGVAALQRIEQLQRKTPSMANRSLNVIRAEAKRELELERTQAAGAAAATPTSKEVVLDSPPVLAVNGVFFNCPLVGPECLPKSEMEVRIKQFLYQQLEEERGLTSCLIIHTCNKNKEKVQLCIETMCKMLTNIVENPNEEKFRRIRTTTKAFLEKIRPVEGALDFLLASGFESRLMPPSGDDAGQPEEVFVFPTEKPVDSEYLLMLQDALRTSEPIRPELDRNVRVFYPAKLLERIEIPPDFYNISAEELKREQMLRSEEAEKMMVMRTKAMRERDALREQRKYRFCLIRVRFPDGILLQGTFKTWDKLSSLLQFVREHLAYDSQPFVLTTSTGDRLTEEESTLAEHYLVPATVVNFSWEGASARGSEPDVYLKDETLALCSRT